MHHIKQIQCVTPGGAAAAVLTLLCLNCDGLRRTHLHSKPCHMSGNCSGPWLSAHVPTLVNPSSSPHFTFEVHNSRAHTALLPYFKWPRPKHMQVQSTGFTCTRQPHILAGPPASYALNI